MKKWIVKRRLHLVIIQKAKYKGWAKLLKASRPVEWVSMTDDNG
jgi:hypothetical protein